MGMARLTIVAAFALAGLALGVLLRSTTHAACVCPAPTWSLQLVENKASDPSVTPNAAWPAAALLTASPGSVKVDATNASTTLSVSAVEGHP